jgi:hypothetical protein
MLVEKRVLSDADLASEVALELPDREMLLITVIITNLLNNNTVEITVRDVNVGASICAAILSNPTGRFDCDVVQS